MENNNNQTISKYLLIYHREDNDGVFSAALIYDYLLNKLNINEDNIDLMPMDYNDMNHLDNHDSIDNLIMDYHIIILTDISFTAKTMKYMYDNLQERMIWIDHHAPIIYQSYKMHFDLVNGVRDTDRSAILCAWKYLYDQFDKQYNAHEIPEFLEILSAWDSFTFSKRGYTKDYVYNVNKGVTFQYKLDFPIVKSMIDTIMYWQECKANGKYIEEDIDLIKSLHHLGQGLNLYDQERFDEIIKNYADKDFKIQTDDNKIRHAVAVFLQSPTSSMMFKSLANTDIKNGIVFKRQADGNWTISLYNVNEDDRWHCGDFMKARYNGGGHLGAAGCVVNEAKFIKILKDKVL